MYSRAKDTSTLQPSFCLAFSVTSQNRYLKRAHNAWFRSVLRFIPVISHVSLSKPCFYTILLRILQGQWLVLYACAYGRLISKGPRFWLNDAATSSPQIMDSHLSVPIDWNPNPTLLATNNFVTNTLRNVLFISCTVIPYGEIEEED